MNELMTMSKEVRITSVELVELINKFRKHESEVTESRYVAKEHSDVMKKLRKEIEVLESVGITNGGNFSLVEYTDTKGENRPCYSLNRDGIMQIAMSESAIVRYKVIEYVNQLEAQVKDLKSQLLLAIYNGGQEGILASKQLTEIEVEEATKPLLETIEVQQPKVDFADTLLKTKDIILVREFAKVLCDEGFNIGEKKLYKWLRENEFLMQNNEPYQRYIDNNTFMVKVGTIDTPFGVKQTRTTKITPEGQLYLFKKIQKEFGEKEVE